MPTYDYKCEKCGNRFEYFQSMSSEPLKICKLCGGPLHRLFGEGAGIIFKGHGFYCTDYHSKNSVSSESHEPQTGESTSPKAVGEGVKSEAPKAPKAPEHKSEGKSSERAC